MELEVVVEASGGVKVSLGQSVHLGWGHIRRAGETAVKLQKEERERGFNPKQAGIQFNTKGRLVPTYHSRKKTILYSSTHTQVYEIICTWLCVTSP